ncbi:hypothetical protein ERJ75_000264300 [Trypanosoma vivax]|nr:hypothetical protein ERJ75_000264300 [Trypanosoma vivax]
MHASVIESISPPEHPIHVRLAKLQHLYSVIAVPEKLRDATVLQRNRCAHVSATTTGGLKADAPEKNNKARAKRSVQRSVDLGYQV